MERGTFSPYRDNAILRRKHETAFVSRTCRLRFCACSDPACIGDAPSPSSKLWSQIQTVMSFRFEAIVAAGVTTTAGAEDVIAAIVKLRTVVKGPPQLAASFISSQACNVAFWHRRRPDTCTRKEPLLLFEKTTGQQTRPRGRLSRQR